MGANDGWVGDLCRHRLDHVGELDSSCDYFPTCGHHGHLDCLGLLQESRVHLPKLSSAL